MSYKPLLDAKGINTGFGQWLIIGIKVFCYGRACDRSHQTFEQIWQIIKCWGSFWYVTDGWKVYPMYIQPEDHLVSKTYMTRVEGENTRLRHYLARLHRKTLCYSKSLEMLKHSIRLLLHYLRFKSLRYSRCKSHLSSPLIQNGTWEFLTSYRSSFIADIVASLQDCSYVRDSDCLTLFDTFKIPRSTALEVSDLNPSVRIVVLGLLVSTKSYPLWIRNLRQLIPQIIRVLAPGFLALSSRALAF